MHVLVTFLIPMMKYLIKTWGRKVLLQDKVHHGRNVWLQELEASGHHTTTNKKQRAINTGTQLAVSSSFSVTLRVGVPPQSIQSKQSFVNVPRDVSRMILEPVNLTM